MREPSDAHACNERQRDTGAQCRAPLASLHLALELEDAAAECRVTLAASESRPRLPVRAAALWDKSCV